MPRDYSKKACYTCKQRRKKCDEELPICGPCRRLNMDCIRSSSTEYRNKPRGATMIGAMDIQSPLVDVKAIRTSTSSSGIEEAVVQNLPKMVVQFFSPTSAPSTRDLRTLWQMTFQDDLVRNALVTCFSPLVGRTTEFAKVEQLAYGRVLRRVKDELGGVQRAPPDTIAVNLAVLFLGLKECIRPERLVDPLQHWKALAMLVGRMTPADISRWSSLPLNMYLMLLEATQYHLVGCAVYSRFLIPAYEAYQTSGILDKLIAANPSGALRIPQSPLLSGQYEIYHMALRLLVLHRSASDEPVDPDELDDLELAIRFHHLTLDDDFKKAAPLGYQVQHAVSVLEVYRMVCNVLLLTLIALREPSPQNVDEFDQMVSKTLDGFWNLPLLHMSYSIPIWALLILVCGIRNDADFETFVEQYNVFKRSFTAGHPSRSTALISHLKEIRATAGQNSSESPSGDVAKAFPIGMSLLRQKEGVIVKSL